MSDRLLELRKQIDDKKRQFAVLSGRREEKLKQLKATGASTLEEGKQLLDSKKKELRRMESKKDKDLASFEEKYSEVL
jgi:hypothetical protein